MPHEFLLPKVHVRNTGDIEKPVKHKHQKIPTFGPGGNKRYSDVVVAGVLFDLKRKTTSEVSSTWGISIATIHKWYTGQNRAHVKPCEWPADKPKRGAR